MGWSEGDSTQCLLRECSCNNYTVLETMLCCHSTYIGSANGTCTRKPCSTYNKQVPHVCNILGMFVHDVTHPIMARCKMHAHMCEEGSLKMSVCLV